MTSQTTFTVDVPVPVTEEELRRIAVIFGIDPDEKDFEQPLRDPLEKIATAALEEYLLSFAGTRAPSTMREIRELRLHSTPSASTAPVDVIGHDWGAFTTGRVHHWPSASPFLTGSAATSRCRWGIRRRSFAQASTRSARAPTHCSLIPGLAERAPLQDDFTGFARSPPRTPTSNKPSPTSRERVG